MRDWAALKRGWLSGRWPTLRAFAEARKIPFDTVRKQAAKYHWHKDSTKVAQKAEQGAKDRIAKSMAAKIAEMHEEHYKAGSALIGYGLRKAKEKGVNSPEQAIRVGADVRTRSVGEPTQIVEEYEEFTITDEDRRAAREAELRSVRRRRRSA